MSRRFVGLRDRPPQPRYDAVVIGAGIGGLVCAALLCGAGMRTLLVEQHYMAGGYCSTFRRRGFTFDASTHFYPLLGNPETITGRLLRDLGVETRWIKMDPVDTFHLPDGTRFDVPADLDAYLDAVKRRFPNEAAAVDRFFNDVRRAYVIGLQHYFRDQPAARLGEYEPLTVRDMLDRHFSDPRLKLLLTADCPHWGSPPARTSFIFDAMLRLSYFLGNYYPEGGSQHFADELGRVVEARGGDILMSTRVERIAVEHGRVTGVEIETTRGALRGRRSVAAEVVVSNADLLLTLERLLGAAADPEQVATVRRLRPTFPCFLSHLGVRDCDRRELQRAQGYYWQGWDPDLVGRGALRCKIFVPTLYAPDLAPPGGDVVILQKVLELDSDEVTDWSAHKSAVEAYVFDHLRQVLPGIERHVVVRLSASARTAERFTFNRRGAMLGWEMSPDQLGQKRPALASTIRGLYFVGHWTRPGGGVTPVIVSAMQAAAAIQAGRHAAND
ncbi:MAG: phytoene desaturase family protein [Acidobacteriota bacterium]